MFASKRIRFFSEREGLTLNTGKILEKKLQKSQYLPEEKGEQFAAKVWSVFKSINTGLERPEGYHHMAGGTYMPLSMLLAPAHGAKSCTSSANCNVAWRRSTGGPGEIEAEDPGGASS